jgi:hypothetical protein
MGQRADAGEYRQARSQAGFDQARGPLIPNDSPHRKRCGGALQKSRRQRNLESLPRMISVMQGRGA